MNFPRIIVHADWGSAPGKRWMCVAEGGADGSFVVRAPQLVGELGTLFQRLLQTSCGSVLIGFDFPIGIPEAYARRAGIDDFSEALRGFGWGAWADFYDIAEVAADVSIKRPFYPYRPGGTRQRHLVDGLGVRSMSDLLRRCERSTPTRGPASPLFWTLGAKQVGRAAIIGWRDLLRPALSDDKIDLAIWPFDGELGELLQHRHVTVVETYPAEACVHLGLIPPGRGWSKRKQDDRRQQASAIRRWAANRRVGLDAPLMSALEGGFGPSNDAEDPFDAALGAFSMLEVVLGHRPAGAPSDRAIQNVEGWILGQESDVEPSLV